MFYLLIIPERYVGLTATYKGKQTTFKVNLLLLREKSVLYQQRAVVSICLQYGAT